MDKKLQFQVEEQEHPSSAQSCVLLPVLVDQPVKEDTGK